MAALTAVPGIGPWTAQGALVISFQREDVVLPGDLALRKAVRAVYQLDHLPTEQEMLGIAERWRPYRTLGTFYVYSAPFQPCPGGVWPSPPAGMTRGDDQGPADDRGVRAGPAWL